MKKYLLICVLCFIFISCNNDDSIDCALFDPAFPQLSVKFVDNDENNLIKNGFLNPDNIIVLNTEGKSVGTVILPDGFEVNPDNNPFNYTLSIVSPNSSSETYNIHLEENTIEVLTIESELKNIPCGISFYTPISATYNNMKITVNEENLLDFIITVIR